jgi:hypothetical protein
MNSSCFVRGFPKYLVISLKIIAITNDAATPKVPAPDVKFMYMDAGKKIRIAVSMAIKLLQVSPGLRDDEFSCTDLVIQKPPTISNRKASPKQ